MGKIFPSTKFLCLIFLLQIQLYTLQITLQFNFAFGFRVFTIISHESATYIRHESATYNLFQIDKVFTTSKFITVFIGILKQSTTSRTSKLV